ncbi:adenylate-forming reductase [Capsicum chacoense]
MKNEDKFERFSSCRGVAFEIKPRNDPFSVPIPPSIESNSRGSARFWLPWENIRKKIAPSSSFMTRSMSRASSTHFCDLDVDEDENEDDDSLSDIEKGYYEKEGSILQIPQVGSSPLPFLPPKTLSKRENKNHFSSRLSIILLDQGFFTVYKRLFALSFVLNITFLVLACTGNFAYARRKAVLFSIGNIFALTLCRSEAFLRGLFWFAVNCFGWSWIPIQIKTIFTSLLQSLGGIHSGCAISSIAWLIYALVLTLNDKENTSPEIVSVAFAILLLLSLSSLVAFPLVRHLHHNFFERIHRFIGWIALTLLWIFITLTVSYDPKTKSYNAKIGTKLIKQQEFCFTLAITILIIIPWMTVRCVPVRVTSPSGHASIIKFEGGIKPGILGRISPSPFSEWHAFGIISDGKTEHMMLAGAVGDFTKSLVANPPRHLWVRQVHFAGLPYLVNMYNRVLVVATGSGICVFLSFLLQHTAANVCLLWVTKGVEQNYGKEIQEMVTGHPKEKVIIHDTALLGRPNVSEMSVDIARKWQAEVVIVTSNPEGSRDVVNACKKSGIPAFGPIWDS